MPLIISLVPCAYRRHVELISSFSPEGTIYASLHPKQAQAVIGSTSRVVASPWPQTTRPPAA